MVKKKNETDHLVKMIDRWRDDNVGPAKKGKTKNEKINFSKLKKLVHINNPTDETNTN